MAKKTPIIFLLLIIILLNQTFAIDINSIKNNMDQASSEIQQFFTSIPKKDIIIVTGKKVSMEDKMLFNMIKSQSDEMIGIKIVTDINALQNQDILNKNLVFIGSSKTNILSKKMSDNINFEQESTYSPIIIHKGNEGDKKYMMIFSQKEMKNNENHAIKKSPLNKIMDEKYVPIVATFLSIFFLYLWQVIGKTIMESINEFISSKLMDKKAEKTKKKRIKKNEFINIHEVIAFFVTTIIFSLTMSWTWTRNIDEFKRIFLINFCVVGIITMIRELSRLIFCYRLKLRSELLLWPFGTILTFISTFLGNTFSLVSYTLLYEDQKDMKRFGKVSFLITIFTFILSISAYVLNMINPSLILQMTFVYSMMILFIDLFPREPFAGHEIKNWNMPAWIISYIFVIISYIYMNFTVYV